MEISSSVFLATNRQGYESFIKLNTYSIPLWVSAEVISSNEITTLRRSGFDITIFTHSLEHTNNIRVEQAIHSIKEHYPNCTVWVGY